MVDSLHLIWIKAWEQSNLESQKSDQVEEHQINKLHNGFLWFWNIPQQLHRLGIDLGTSKLKVCFLYLYI